MLKRILLSGVALTFCAGMAVAQTAAPDQSTPPAAQGGGGSMSAPSTGAGANTSENQADASLFSNIKGADVVGSDNKEVGRLADILLDDQGNIQQIVIGSGGIAGVGETLHAYDQASLPALNSDGKIQLGLTTASLDSLPEYSYPEKVETGRATTGDTGGGMSSGSGSAGSGAMAPNPSAPSSGAASGGAASGGSQPSADASSGAASGSSSGNMLSSDNAGSQMGAAGGGSSAPESGAATSGADQSASAESGMSKDAGSSAGTASDQSTAANTGGAASSSASGASGGSSAPDQMAANDTGAAAGGGKAWPASYLVGANIANAPDSAEVGDLHFAGSKVDKVVINHGGTLGVGEKQMEVAFNDLQISGDPTDPKVELQGDPLQQLNKAAEEDRAKKDMSPEK